MNMWIAPHMIMAQLKYRNCSVFLCIYIQPRVSQHSRADMFAMAIGGIDCLSFHLHWCTWMLHLRFVEYFLVVCWTTFYGWLMPTLYLCESSQFLHSFTAMSLHSFAATCLCNLCLFCVAQHTLLKFEKLAVSKLGLCRGFWAKSPCTTLEFEIL